jgi:hypothetical protein
MLCEITFFRGNVISHRKEHRKKHRKEEERDLAQEGGGRNGHQTFLVTRMNARRA